LTSSESLTAKQLEKLLCAQGFKQGVTRWYLRKSQKEIYDLLQKERFAFIEAARRFGKTTSMLAFVFNKLVENPGWICRWCFPDKNQAREVLMAEVEKMQAHADDEDKFIYRHVDSYYVHPNGARLYLRGVNHDRGDSARGPAANIIIADEYGFWVEPDYIIREALMPQLQGQEGRWLIKASTPPRDLGHIYYIEREEAVKRGRFIQKTIYQNEGLSPEELQEIIDECGGTDSPSFRRERMCEPVSDPDMLIIPEWSDDENMVSDDYERPQFFTPYVGGDSGADDNTFICFGYYDFRKDEVIVEKELMLMGKTTQTIVEAAKMIESELWGETRPKRRVYDAPKQLIIDIFTDHKWPVGMPMKEDKLAAIHDLRVEVGSRRFKVKESCKNLARQMKVGMWRDEKHTDFQRSEGLGHLDGIAAAIYLNRCIDRKLNPMPQHHGLHRETHFINKQREAVSQDLGVRALESLLGPKRMGHADLLRGRKG
jgi:Terminase large subunit, T4likevirus-type, N-terminal